MSTYAGIDVGVSGAVAFTHTGRCPASAYPFAKYTIRDLANILKNFKPEHVSLECPPGYMPKNGKKSIKSLFQNYGIWVGILETLGLRYTPVTPQTWQRDMGCMTGGDKRITHREARKLFPRIKVTHNIADALIIAEYSRVIYHEPF